MVHTVWSTQHYGFYDMDHILWSILVINRPGTKEMKSTKSNNKFLKIISYSIYLGANFLFQ